MIGALDFAAMPPEINSTRMYTGPGSAPLVMAAAAWTTLATELSSAATSYRAALAELTGGPWVGPAAWSMAAAATPYVSWMNATAAQATQAAGQLGSAIAAYEAAFAATVPPMEIEVNRALLASLVATNTFGQNTPAIAATEGQYAQMWAQDAAAMYGYAGASAAATTLTPFSPPPQTTDPAGSATQAAVTPATAGAGPSTQSALSSVPNLLQSVSAGPAADSNPLLDFLNSAPIQLFNQFSSLTVGYQILSEGLNFDASGLCLTIAPPIAAFWNPVVTALTAAPAAAASDVTGAGGLDAGLGSSLIDSYGSSASAGGAGLSAGLGEAATVGSLSVPPSWGDSPAIRLAATALPIAGLDGLPQAGAAAPGFFGGMPSMGPIASVVNAPRGDQTRIRSGQRQRVVAALPGESDMDHDAAARWVSANANADGDRAAGERDELNQLRKAIADVARQRDVLKRTAATLIKEATNE